MSMRSYGICQQGAVFHQDDFDPVKVINAVSKNILEIDLPENIRKALTDNEFNTEIANELCRLLDVTLDEGEEPQDYSQISKVLIEGADLDEWFQGPEPLMGTKDVVAVVLTDIEGDIVYADKDVGSELVNDVWILSLDWPLVWEIAKYDGACTKEEVLLLIKEAASSLLKDDIDWEKRLAFLIGSATG